MISVAKSLFVALAFWSFEPGTRAVANLERFTIIVPAPVGGPTDLLARISGTSFAALSAIRLSWTIAQGRSEVLALRRSLALSPTAIPCSVRPVHPSFEPADQQ
jgi:Uncharacterized protein conserved in bacteria